jgi:hypothetical protein
VSAAPTDLFMGRVYSADVRIAKNFGRERCP